MERVVQSCRKAIPLSTLGTTTQPIQKVAGFFVNSTNAGTIQFSDGNSALGGTITPPAVGFYPFPYEFQNGCKVTLGGTAINVTIFAD